MADDQFQFADPGPRLYCGNKDALPPGYDEMGDRYRCLRKGVGVGIYTIPEEKRQRLLANRRINRLRPDEIRDIAHRLGIDIGDKNDVVLLQEIGGRLDLLRQNL